MDVYHHLIRVINSCNTFAQLEVADEYVDRVYNNYIDLTDYEYKYLKTQKEEMEYLLQ